MKGASRVFQAFEGSFKRGFRRDFKGDLRRRLLNKGFKEHFLFQNSRRGLQAASQASLKSLQLIQFEKPLLKPLFKKFKETYLPVWRAARTNGGQRGAVLEKQTMDQVTNAKLISSLENKMGTSNVFYVTARKDVQFFPSNLSTFASTSSSGKDSTDHRCPSGPFKRLDPPFVPLQAPL